MTAKELVSELGERLVGRRVLTYRYGAWPTSEAVVTEIRPDANAPEIVFMVDGSGSAKVRKAIQDGDLDDAVIGVFENEEVLLLAHA